MPERIAALKKWLGGFEPRPITNDASFRRYFRVEIDGAVRIAMDAPPAREDSRPYLDVGKRLLRAGLNAPEVLAEDLEQGFFLLTDLGDELYLPLLDESSVERLYGDALSALAVMQVCVDSAGLPLYDHALLHREMELFPDWLLGKHLNMEISAEDGAALRACFEFLSQAALAQPQVFVHRDYHSRNLLRTPQHNPGIVDFQDAVIGPVTYDLVSLLRDCYIVWPPARVREWVTGYYELARQMGILDEHVSEAKFLRWFDLMGLQRHVKVAGIFARLCHRDGKTAYLQDIPTALHYIVEAGAAYPEVRYLVTLTEQRVLPAFLQTLK